MKLSQILILNHNVEWRGTFQRCYDFAKILTGNGHEVTIVTNAPSARFRFDEHTLNGVKIVRSPDLFWGILRSGWDPMNVIRRYRHLKNKHFDIIHAFDNRPTVILPALKLKKLWQCPLVSDWCDWWGRGGAITLRKNKVLNRLFEPIETYFEEHYRKDADFLTVISAPLRDRAIKLGYPSDRIEIIPPIAHVDEIFPVDKKEARKKLNISDYSHVLIFSGFVLYDFEVVLQAFRLVHKKFPKCLLLLTGAVPQQMIESLSLPILNLGFVPHETFQMCLGASDLCLLPLSDCLTNQARFPHKIGHYLASGHPIVTSPVGDAGRLIKEYGAGFLTESTPEAFAGAICDALSDPEDLNQRGLGARKLAEERLSPNRFKVVLERIYESCFSGHPSNLI